MQICSKTCSPCLSNMLIQPQSASGQRIQKKRTSKQSDIKLSENIYTTYVTKRPFDRQNRFLVRFVEGRSCRGHLQHSPKRSLFCMLVMFTPAFCYHSITATGGRRGGHLSFSTPWVPTWGGGTAKSSWKLDSSSNLCAPATTCRVATMSSKMASI